MRPNVVPTGVQDDVADGVWTFDRFRPGQIFAPVVIALDERRASLWTEVYGAIHGDAAPAGLIVAAMMEAYIRAIQRRPQGNVHAGQQLAFTPFRPRMNDSLRVDFSCVSKELRKGRRWVIFASTVGVGAEVAMTARIQAIWAA